MDEFLIEGMKRYKKASATMVGFGKAVEERLQGILSGRPPEKWGRFVPTGESKVKSTKYWSEYPLFNAKIDGDVDGTPLRISIDVNWYQAKGDHPFFAVWLDPYERHAAAIRGFEWAPGITTMDEDCGIQLEPDLDRLDLEHDFGLLLDEMVQLLDQRATGRGGS